MIWGKCRVEVFYFSLEFLKTEKTGMFYFSRNVAC